LIKTQRFKLTETNIFVHYLTALAMTHNYRVFYIQSLIKQTKLLMVSGEMIVAY